MPKQNSNLRLRIVPDADTTQPSTKRARIAVRMHHPNPLFERWLQEMIAKAEERNTMGRIPLQKALESLRMFPLPLASGRDCFILAHFGRTICEALDQKLRAHVANGGETLGSCREVVERVLNDRREGHYRELVRVLGKGEEDVAAEVEYQLPEDLDLGDTEDEMEPCAGTSSEPAEQVVNIWDPKVILLVDTAETIGKSKSNLDRTLKALQQNHVEHEVRRLSVGDFLWIVRDDTGAEFILPYIVERKRMDDLASSIKDGRFHEQKFRLKQCGLANVIYLIEHLGNNRQVGVPASTLSQAALNTFVQDFTVKYTENHLHTVLYLATMTGLLGKNVKNKTFQNITNQLGEATKDFNLSHSTIPLIAFETFNKQSSKTRACTVREIFMKQLLQVKLLTIEKVNAIVERYPTPRKLFLAFERCTSEDQKERLLNLPYGPAKRNIGLKLSKIVYQLFMSDVYQR
ncbi:crossover junction endonuclease MUS81 [Culex pipiens pallens]|uniref:crossover junction endonuclease MUS81 n=1 Tax=Culex pipiens pallens TaxID=42434 RepID=UPI001954F4A0|nr:crossover junction endonuclease MUS81 [Culex pipiens pallens]